MDQASARFSVLALAVFAAAMAVNLALFALALDLPSKRSIGMCSMVDQRIALAQAAPSPKMLIVGGSGTTQGINAQALGETLGLRAQNFGLHGSYGPGLDLYLARKALRPGDTVLLTFEYSAYLLDKPTDVALDALFGCAHDYLAQFNLADQARIATGFPPMALWDRLTLAATREKPEHLPVYTAWGDRPANSSTDPGPEQAHRIALYRPMQVAVAPNVAATRDIAEFAAWAYRHRIAVIATWPNTLAFEEYRTMPGFADIRRFYEHLGVPVVGEPQLAMLPAEYMYDTQYHLNDAGIRVRTARLGEALAGRPELLAPLRSN